MPKPQLVTDADTSPEADPTPSSRIVTVDYDGHTYTYDLDKVTLDALEDYDDGKYIRAVRAILGPEQWAEYKSRHPLGVDLDRFIAALLTAAGALGNSPASSAS
jgi:hypothetical protein